MAEHKNLTGADLHEPKGVESASANDVYHADGAGSGTWQDPLSRVLNLNSFSLSATVPDVSSTDSAWLAIEQDCSLEIMTGILQGPITVASSTLTLYKNGVSQTQTLVVNYSGSAAGSRFSTTLAPAVSFSTGDVLELRSNGGSTDAASLYCTFKFSAV